MAAKKQQPTEDSFESRNGGRSKNMRSKLDPATIDLEEMLANDAKTQAENQAARFDLEDLKKKGAELEYMKECVDGLMKEASALNEQIRILETETLPDMLKALGIKDFTLLSGAKISLYDIISASITDDNREPAHEWLREHGHGDIIKNNLTLSFGKGEDDFAKKITEDLLQMRRDGLIKFGDLVQKEDVHPQTLKAFVKTKISDGTEFPGELFKLYTGQAVEFKKPK